jgi:hypothetical protein
MATAPPAHPFNVYRTNLETGTKAIHVGGSGDVATAISIACAAYIVAQNYSPTSDEAFVVYDELDAAVAFIGAYTPPPA